MTASNGSDNPPASSESAAVATAPVHDAAEAAPAPDTAAPRPATTVPPSTTTAAAPAYQRAPASTRWLLAPLLWLDRQCNRLVGAAWNPLYRSGTWATTLMLLALVTGIYLLLFYRVSAPYQSVHDMMARPWVVGWVRSLHRYASDAAMVAVGIHIIRMLAEGKSWGSRVVAWLSGLILVGIVMVVGFTGFVMVWDSQAQALALGGAKLMSVVPIFDRDIGGTFDNVTPPPSSFIFMNLLVHLLLPLALFGALWLHTVRVARAKWLLPWRITLGATAALTVLALVVAAPLGARPDPLIHQATTQLDIFFGAWLPLGTLPSWLSWTVVLGLLGVLGLAPWLTRPAAAERAPVSQNDERHCEGCEQCVKDCPFDAIEMVPRSLGTGSPLVAHVDPGLCVSCGICAGSCSSLAIGPPDRSGHTQLIQIKSLWKQAPQAKCAVLHCRNGNFAAGFPQLEATYGKLVAYGIDCVGNLHPSGISQLLKHFTAVVVVSCPPEGCQMREGAEVAYARLFLRRGPSELPPDAPIGWITASPGDHGRIGREFDAIARKHLGYTGPALPPRSHLERVLRWASSAALATGVLGLLAAGSHVPYGRPSAQAKLKLNWRMQTPRVETCETVSAEELERLPVHMRQAQRCKREAVPYELRLVWGDGSSERIDLQAAGAQHNGPMIVDLARTLAPGTYRLEVVFEPAAAAPASAPRWRETFEFSLEANQAAFVTVEPKSLRMVLLQPHPQPPPPLTPR